MADTLSSVAGDELQKAQNAQASIAADLQQAQSDVVQKQKDLDTAMADLKALNDQAASIRRQIAETTVAAEGDQLFADLEAKNVEVHAKQADITRLQEEAADARSRVTAGNVAAGLATARVKAANQAKDEATARSAADVVFKDKATSPPLSDLPAATDVNQDPAKAAMQAALDRLQADVPQELLDRAHARRGHARVRLDAVVWQARAAADREALVGASSGQAGTRIRTGLAFDRAEAALADFVQAAPARHDRALALLAGVAASTPLSNAEKQRLTGLRDDAHALEDQNTHEDAFTLAGKVIEAQGQVDAKNDEIAAARLDALAAHPDADPEADQNVQDREAELPPLNQALGAAQAALTNDMKAKLAALDAAVPDATWGLIDQYEEALVLLGDVHGVNPGQLGNDLNAAEIPYAQALRAELDTADTIDSFRRRARESSDRADASAPLRPARLLQALRGDD